MIIILTVLLSIVLGALFSYIFILVSSTSIKEKNHEMLSDCLIRYKVGKVGIKKGGVEKEYSPPN